MSGRDLPLALVLDDAPDMRQILSRLADRHGFEVIEAADGISGLELAKERRPDLILLDIEMPRMNGFEFLEALRADASFSDIPVIMISSRSGEKHRGQAATLGVRAFLGKPFKERELLAAMEGIAGWRS